MLIEVVISALLVALIAVATLTGIDVTNRSTADERFHNEATVIAQQDEDRMRGMTVSELGQFGTSTQTVAENGQCIEKFSSAWRYCEGTTSPHEKYTGTVFTVKSSAEYVTAGTEASAEAFTCETSGGTADYIQTSSSVSWPSLGSHKPVSQSSIVSVPVGRALLIKVANQNAEAVPGATVSVTNAGSQTTPTSGCVIFGALAAEPASVTATAEKALWVEKNGKSTATETLTPATAATTPKTFTIGEAGAIQASFTSNGSSAFGDTFVAVQTGMSTPQYVLEGTASPKAPPSYLSSVTSTKTLFPFVNQGHPATNNPYTVYAGDCTENDPTKQTAFTNATAQVNPGSTATPTLTVPPVKILVRTGSGAGSEGTVVTSATGGLASLTNTKCVGKTPLNEGSFSYVHYQPLNVGGHLTYQGVPFGEFKLCVSGTVEGKTRKWTGSFTNNSTSGPTTLPGNGATNGEGYRIIYLGSGASGTGTESC